MAGRLSIALLAATMWLEAAAYMAADRLLVYTVNYPLQYFAERIAGDQAEVVLPVPADVDPAFWQPDATTIGEYQQADVILLNGAGYAKWLSNVSLPSRKVVDTSADFRDRYIKTQEGTTHSHGREGEHSHTGTAFTTWLDFTQAAAQARAVRDALSRRMPDQATTFSAHCEALERDLLDLDAQLAAMVERDPAKPLLASHPVYQYLARRYALNLKPVMWEPDTMPPEAEWKALEDLRSEHPAHWMLWEDEPATPIAERLRQLGVQSAVFNPCANRPATGDFLTVMSSNLASMKRVFDQAASEHTR